MGLKKCRSKHMILKYKAGGQYTYNTMAVCASSNALHTKHIQLNN